MPPCLLDPHPRLGAAVRREEEDVLASWTGGEDHALAATFPFGTVPPEWLVVGTVSEGDGVTVDGKEWSGDKGWDHFPR